QAEDGIRDFHVTGVQTCALPISVATAKRPPATPITPDEAAEEANLAAKAYIHTAEQEGLIEGEERRLLQSIVDFGDTLIREVMKIGRASCRKECRAGEWEVQ